MPAVRGLAESLLAPMDFSIFYDERAQTDCDVNASLPGDPPTGQMYGGYYVDQGPAGYHNSSLTFVPTFAGGMFEGLMANLVVPETTWGPHSFGLDDLRWAQVQEKYATDELGYRVWGMSPSSTADDSGDYGGFGVEGLAFGTGSPLAWCTTCATETTVTPHASAIALPVLPQAAYANLVKLRALYPGIYTSDGGFYDAVNPVTGEVGHRRLVLDQSMVMAGIDDALVGGALQRHFGADPESWAARLYLSYERMSIG